MVELRGLEPLTPTLPVWCATSCAIAPRSCAHRSYTTAKTVSKSLARPLPNGLVDHLAGDFLDLGQVLGSVEGLRINLVDVLGAGRPRGEPRVGGRHLQPAQRRAV